jgi:hypothetical protein
LSLIRSFPPLFSVGDESACWRVSIKMKKSKKEYRREN